MSIANLFLFGLAFSGQVPSPNPAIRVDFKLTSPDLPSETTVYITGSLDQIGSWNPGRVKMDPLGNHRWHKEIRVDKPGLIEYKYTLGSWEREGADAHGSPLQNLQVRVNGDTTADDKILNWTKAGKKPALQGQITGTVEYHRAMKGDGLRDRDVIVWLPPDYKTSPKRRYPVLYMHDGQNAFDPATSAFGVDWQADETADRLIRAKEIPPLIMVGIYNSPDRTAEYSPGTKGTAYMNFVVNKLKPFIDATYRTKTDRRSTFNCGSSMGGLISFMLAWEHPETFGGAICMSPAFREPSPHPKWDYIFDITRTKNRKRDDLIYVDIGGIGVDEALSFGVASMVSMLTSCGYQKGKDMMFVKDPKARHSEADWAKRFPKALKFILGSRQ